MLLPQKSLRDHKVLCHPGTKCNEFTASAIKFHERNIELDDSVAVEVMAEHFFRNWWLKWDTRGRIARGFPPVVGKKPLPLRGTINVDRVVVRLWQIYTISCFISVAASYTRVLYDNLRLTIWMGDEYPMQKASKHHILQVKCSWSCLKGLKS